MVAHTLVGGAIQIFSPKGNSTDESIHYVVLIHIPKRRFTYQWDIFLSLSIHQIEEEKKRFNFNRLLKLSSGRAKRNFHNFQVIHFNLGFYLIATKSTWSTSVCENCVTWSLSEDLFLALFFVRKLFFLNFFDSLEFFYFFSRLLGFYIIFFFALSTLCLLDRTLSDLRFSLISPRWTIFLHSLSHLHPTQLTSKETLRKIEILMLFGYKIGPKTLINPTNNGWLRRDVEQKAVRRDVSAAASVFGRSCSGKKLK